MRGGQIGPWAGMAARNAATRHAMSDKDSLAGLLSVLSVREMMRMMELPHACSCVVSVCMRFSAASQGRARRVN